MPYSSDRFQIISSAVGSACFCYLFGGNWFDCLTSCFLGAVLYIFVIAASRKNITKILINILGSSLVTLCGALLFNFGIGDHLDKVIIGSIIPMVPGVALTTAIRDFFSSDYLSGIIRMIHAIIIASSIALGVGVTLKFCNLILGVSI